MRKFVVLLFAVAKMLRIEKLVLRRFGKKEVSSFCHINASADWHFYIGGEEVKKRVVYLQTAILTASVDTLFGYGVTGTREVEWGPPLSLIERDSSSAIEIERRVEEYLAANNPKAIPYAPSESTPAELIDQITQFLLRTSDSFLYGANATFADGNTGIRIIALPIG